MEQPNATVAETPAKPLTGAERFVQFKASAEAAKTPEAIAAKAVADAAAAKVPTPVAAPVVPGAAAEPERRASGDERKFRNIERRFNQELGKVKEQLTQALAANGKPAAAATSAAAPDPATAPKRADFPAGGPGDEQFNDAKIAHGVKRELEKTTAAAVQAKEISETLASYNEQIAKGPEKYDDWDAVLEAGKGGALSVDLGKECPSLMWAIASSPYAADCFYAWLKDATKLQGLIDTYKSGPKGEIAAITAFHRFEGQVGKDASVKAADKAAPQKADDAARETPKTPKPKPSAEIAVRGGAAAPDGKPALYLPGTHTVNPAYLVYARQQRANK